jgi:hypothetical protein
MMQLEDLKQLRDYGIEDGSVLAHVSVDGDRLTASAAPRSEQVDYARIAALLQEARSVSLAGREHDPADYTPSAARRRP